MTPDKVRELYHKRIAAREYAHGLSALNTPTDPDELLKADVRFNMAWDAFMKADQECREAISSLSADELAGMVWQTAGDVVAEKAG